MGLIPPSMISRLQTSNMDRSALYLAEEHELAEKPTLDRQSLLLEANDALTEFVAIYHEYKMPRGYTECRIKEHESICPDGKLE